MSNFIPNPLHPAVVHMPIALILLLPFFAVGSMRAIRLGARPLRGSPWSGGTVSQYGGQDHRREPRPHPSPAAMIADQVAISVAC